jgi:hypothetical protein
LNKEFVAMNKFTRFSARASLASIGQHMRQLKIWEKVERYVQINQKVRKHRPLEKLLDAFINILAGGQGMVEVNTRVRPDEGLQRAFGRKNCAEQSVISETLNQCEQETVGQMRQAVSETIQTHGQGVRHNYQAQCLLLDVDMTGMPAGRQGEGVSKGYFSGQKNQRGRQLGRVIATLYDEILVDRLYTGKRQLERSLQELVQAAADVLDLTKRQIARTILRVDAGGGTDLNINWMLGMGYKLMAKMKSGKRARKLAQSVTIWYTDPKLPEREVGWVEAPFAYVRPTRQLALRTRKKDDQWAYHVLVFTLSNDELFWLARQPVLNNPTPEQALFAALYAYDLRSGGVETSNKGSKQGLGLTKRNKRLFAAQEMLVLLAQLAYNLITWTQLFLNQHTSRFRKFGVLRMVRDVFHIPGQIDLDAQGFLIAIRLQALHPYAPAFAGAMSSLVSLDDSLSNLHQI